MRLETVKKLEVTWVLEEEVKKIDVKTQEILVLQVSSLEEKVAWQLLAGEHCTFGGIHFAASCLLC